MRSEFIPEANEFRSPFFVNPLPFLYRMTYRNAKKRQGEITYNSPHEVILNLHVFANDDTVTYINKETGSPVFTITIDRFKVMIADSTVNATQDDLEQLYLRLILTNCHSKAVVDKGRLRHYDSVFRKYLITIKSGFDAYLTYENKKMVLYFKYRRFSALHLCAVIQEWNCKNDVQVNHINIPHEVSCKNLIYEFFRMEFNKNFLKMYTYKPVPDDNVLTTKIDSEINQIINQLIK